MPTPSPTSQITTRHRRKWRKALLVLLLGLIVLGGFALVALRFPSQLLCLDTGPVVQADAIVLLGGGAGERPARAAELFRDGVAGTILVSGAGDANDNRRLLVKRGVPPSAIHMEPNSTTTKQNAQFSIPLLRKIGAKRVVIVTSWYHSRRALRCFEHYGKDIQFFSRPSYFAYAPTEWSRERTNRRIRLEYLKLIGYWIRYGVCPF